MWYTLREMKSLLFGLVVVACAVPFLSPANTCLVPQPRAVRETGGVFAPTASVEKIVRFERDSAVPAEGYRLSVTASGVRIVSADEAGAFYALKTLEQLAVKAGKSLVYPCVEIKDAPAYRYRGLMVDDARHFLGKEVLKKELDLMARHKLNVFHWHLTDDQGWRLEIKGHPELVQYGSVRPASVVFGGRPRWDKPGLEGIRYDFNTEKYGPFFYTQEDVREIVAYAQARHITVIPEIEMPGHVRALLAARPDLGCRGEKLERVPRVLWSIEPDVLCVGNDDVLAYYRDIFDEVCALFPSEIIHIGGDECPKLRWKECPKCQAKMKALGLRDERGLQSWLTAEIVAYLAGKGRRTIGWDEVLHGDVPKSVIGMSWRTSAKGGAGGDFVSAAEALEKGFDMVMTPNDQCYFSAPQALSDDPYPYYASGYGIPLEKAYAFDPVAGIGEAAAKHVLGGQASVWGEMIFNVFDFEWKTWPRTCALAEALWTAPVKRDFREFRLRMAAHRRRLIADHVNCAPVE